MEKTISSNQASLIFCIFAIGLKLSALPATMFSYSGNDSYITCLIALIFDFIGTLILVHIMHKIPHKTFFDLIKDALGKSVAIIVHVLLLIYFLGKCVLVLQELHDYFIATLFEDLNPVLFIIVLGLIILYATGKNFRTVGRVIELIFWPTFIGILFTLLFPTEDIQIEKLLPIFEQGINPIWKGLARTTFAFGDYTILIPIMGKVALDKKSKKRMLLYALNVFNFIFSFYVIFVGSFGKFSMSQTLALGELPLHNTTPATIGKLEWLTIIIWTIILLVDATILAVACRSVFDSIFISTGKKYVPIVLTVVIIGIVAFTYLQLETIIQFAVTPLFSSISGGFQTLLIILIVVAYFIDKKKNKKNDFQNIPNPQIKARKHKC